MIHFWLKMATKFLRTSDLARAVGIHPNTVRLYVDWGLIPPVERSPSGYRQFTQRHLDCLRLARLIYASEYPGRALRGSANEIIQCAVMDDWLGAFKKAQEHQGSVNAEIKQAEQSAILLEHWAQSIKASDNENRLVIGEVSKLLGVSFDMIRNWERNGLISVPRNSYNNYRLFGKKEIERLQIIRMLSRAGYSHMSMLRMFIQLDSGNKRNLKKALNTPREDENIFTAADHWLTTLHEHKKLAKDIIKMIAGISKERQN
jgi:DNA-binding transcriptional MerR regulator